MSSPSLECVSEEAVCRATRTSGGLHIGRTFTFLAVGDKKIYGAWLRQQLESDKPSLLVPGHGQIERGEGLYALLDAEIRAASGPSFAKESKLANLL